MRLESEIQIHYICLAWSNTCRWTYHKYRRLWFYDEFCESLRSMAPKKKPTDQASKKAVNKQKDKVYKDYRIAIDLGKYI